MADPKHEKGESKSTEELKGERQSDATDDEVLKAEEADKDLGAGKDSGAPSPDGAFDEKEEADKAGPM